jgi:diketogulonate reductase-like aldo/keto reductase
VDRPVAGQSLGMINSIPQLSLTGSGTIPQLGFGVFQVPPEDTAAVVDKALETERLGYDYVDLSLIHRPVPSQDKYVETWQALCELYADGADTLDVT